MAGKRVVYVVTDNGEVVFHGSGKEDGEAVALERLLAAVGGSVARAQDAAQWFNRVGRVFAGGRILELAIREVRETPWTGTGDDRYTTMVYTEDPVTCVVCLRRVEYGEAWVPPECCGYEYPRSSVIDQWITVDAVPMKG